MFWWIILIIAIWHIGHARRAPASAPAQQCGWSNGYYWFADGVVQIFDIQQWPSTPGMHGNYYRMQGDQLHCDTITIAPDGRVRFDPYHRSVGGRIAGFLPDYQIVQLLTDGHTDSILT